MRDIHATYQRRFATVPQFDFNCGTNCGSTPVMLPQLVYPFRGNQTVATVADRGGNFGKIELWQTNWGKGQRKAVTYKGAVGMSDFAKSLFDPVGCMSKFAKSFFSFHRRSADRRSNEGRH